MSVANITSLFNKMNLFLAGFFSLLVSPLFFYFWYDKPEIPVFVVVLLYAIWIIGFVLDMRITISNRHLILQHEQNLVFRTIYSRYRPKTSLLIQIMIEVSFVMLMPFLFEGNKTIDFQASGIISSIVGILHLIAWYSNRKSLLIIKEHKQNFPV